MVKFFKKSQTEVIHNAIYGSGGILLQNNQVILKEIKLYLITTTLNTKNQLFT